MEKVFKPIVDPLPKEQLIAELTRDKLLRKTTTAITRCISLHITTLLH